MRRTWRSITAVPAGLGIAAAVLVAAPVANAETTQIAKPVATPSVVGANAPQLGLSWVKPTVDADDTLTGFLIYATPSLTGVANPFRADPTASGCASDTSCDYVFPAANITIGTSYTFRVAATTVNVPGGSGESVASDAALVSVAPGAPTGVTVVPGSARLGVSWAAPADSGGRPLTGYTATATGSTGGGTCSPTPATATSCIITTGLTNGTVYTVTVTATNGTGTSSPSAGATGTPVAGINPPSAPAKPTASVAGPSSVSVAFAAPTNGGSPITSYSVTCTPTPAGTSQTQTGTSSPIVVGTLVTGTAYTCTVVASNVQGNGLASVPSDPVTPASLPAPGAPTNLSGAPGDASVALTWTAPAGPPAATGYQVQHSSDSGTTWLPATPLAAASTSASVTGLTNGTAYVFRVRALNGVVEGPWSSASAAVTPGTPGAPTGVTGTPGLTSVSLSWTAPTGALTPTSYQVRYSSNGGTTWTELAATGTTATSAVVSPLTSGTPYLFGVRAIRGSATGSWSANSAAVTPGKPGVPTALAGSAGDARVNLTWTAPAVAAGVPLPTGYQVQYRVSGSTTWLPSTPLAATTTAATVTGLTNGTAYVFQVRAVNGPVLGDWTAPSAAVTPEAPVVLSITLTKAERDRKGLIRIAGETTGLERGDLVNIRVKLYNPRTGEWRKASTIAGVQVNAKGIFRYILDEPRELRVFGKIPGEIRSTSVKVPRA